MGEIKLTNAQLGRQTKPHPAVEDIVYRHAFLIVEQKRPGVPSSLSRHILCANSDEERDEWIQALMVNIRQGDNKSSSNIGTSKADNVGGAGNNNGTNTKKATKKGDKARKISKVEIRPVAAAPIRHMKPTAGADMDKLTSVPAVNVVPLSSPTLDNSNSNVMDECKSPTSDCAPEPSPSSSSSAALSTSLPNMHVSPMLGGHYQPQLTSPPLPSQQGSTTPPSASTSSSISSPPPPPPPPHQTACSRDTPRRNSTSNVSESMDDDPARLRQTMGSPIPIAIRSSEDLVLDSGNNDISERRVKQKANRVTMWGKKMFSSSSSGSGSSSSNMDGVGSLGPSARPSTSSSLAPTDNSTSDPASRMSSVPSGFRSFLSRSSNDSNERHSEDSNGSKQVFGVPLEDAVRVSRVVEGYELPSVVYRCIEYLDAKKAVMEEGLYRLSGSNMVIQKLKKKFNQGKLKMVRCIKVLTLLLSRW